jgi:hypothetical protein
MLLDYCRPVDTHDLDWTCWAKWLFLVGLASVGFFHIVELARRILG